MDENYSRGFTLDNGLLVSNHHAKTLIINRLLIWGYSLEDRRQVADMIISENGYYGYTISGLVRAARDLILIGKAREVINGTAPIGSRNTKI